MWALLKRTRKKAGPAHQHATSGPPSPLARQAPTPLSLFGAGGVSSIAQLTRAGTCQRQRCSSGENEKYNIESREKVIYCPIIMMMMMMNVEENNNSIFRSYQLSSKSIKDATSKKTKHRARRNKEIYSLI